MTSLLTEVVWHAEAACRGPNQQIFYPPTRSERRSDKREREARAKEICAQCKVLVECRAAAMSSQEQHGIWGGMTERERREIFRANQN